MLVPGDGRRSDARLLLVQVAPSVGSHGWTYRAEFTAEPASVRDARLFVCGLLHAYGLTTMAADVELVVSELATNAVTHARTPFTVEVRRDGPRLVLAVRDGTSQVPVPVSAGARDTRGRGLAIVAALSQDWGSDERPASAKSVWASFTLPAG